MRKNYIINGTDCQCSTSSGLMISKDGKTVALNNFGKPGDTLTILQDASGPYVNNKAGERIDIGDAVADAWLNKYPGNGPKKVKYLDGNVMNTDADNLKWIPDLTPSQE